MRSGISELTIIDFGVGVKNDRKIAEWVIGLSRNQRSYNPEMGGRNAPKYAHVDKKDFQSIYGLSDEQMQNLMKNSDLHYSNWQRTKQCIKKNVIKDFCSSFIVLNRIAKLKCKNVHVFAKELAGIGIFPVQTLKGTRDVFLYSIYDKDDVFSKS